MKKTTNNTKKGYDYSKLQVNFKNIKADFFKSEKAFTEALGKYQVARYELADKKLIYAKAIEQERIKLSVMLEGKDLKTLKKGVKYSKTQIEEQQTKIVKMQDTHKALCKELAERENVARKLVTKELYQSYCSNQNQFEKGLKDFFKSHNMDLTPSTLSYFANAIGYRQSSAKMIKATGYLQALKGERAFVTSFLNALTDLALSKGILNRECYKWQYVAPTPQPRKKATKADTKKSSTKKADTKKTTKKTTKKVA